MFKGLRGNARGCLIYEPLFQIPYNLFITYASVYMLELGVGEAEIGWITTCGLVLQLFTSLISGYLTDRLGRKRALLMFDLLSWSVATLLWAAAQNIWFFIAAMLFNSFMRVPNTAWYCLLVEDSDPKERPAVFTVLQVIGVVGGLFAPLGGLLVFHIGMVPAVRIMYLLGFLCMTFMFWGRNRATYETELGLRKKREYRTMAWMDMVRDYGAVLRSVLANRPMLLMFAVYILFQFQTTLKNTYFSIFLVQYLHYSEAFIAWFPAVTSAVTLAFMYLVSPRLRSERLHLYMILGFLLSAAATILQIATPAGAYSPMVLSTLLAAVGSILVYPYLETAVANTLADEQRAGMMSFLQVLILGFVSPAGVIGGWSYGIDPRLPFGLMIGAFLISAGLITAHKRSCA